MSTYFNNITESVIMNECSPGLHSQCTRSRRLHLNSSDSKAINLKVCGSPEIKLIQGGKRRGIAGILMATRVGLMEVQLEYMYA